MLQENNFSNVFNDEKLIDDAEFQDTTSFNLPINDEKKYEIVVYCNYSINLREEYFTNFLKDNILSGSNRNIVNVILLQGKYLMESELPFNRDGYVKVNNSSERYNNIFSNYTNEMLECHELEDISKAWFRDNITDSDKKFGGNTLRVFYRISSDNNKIEILLFDPHHLVATAKYKTLYKANKNNLVDIKDIVNKKKDLFR